MVVASWWVHLIAGTVLAFVGDGGGRYSTRS
jgi:hypothetical protein